MSIFDDANSGQLSQLLSTTGPMAQRVLEQDEFDMFPNLSDTSPTTSSTQGVPNSERGSTSEAPTDMAGVSPEMLWDVDVDLPDSMFSSSLDPMTSGDPADGAIGSFIHPSSGVVVSPDHIKPEVSSSPPAPASKSEFKYRLELSGVPEKCRVETQQHIRLQLVDDKGHRVSNQKWKTLDVPPELVANTIKSPASRSHTGLSLEARIVCASDTSKEAFSCVRCIKREQRMLERKRNKAAKTKQSSTPSSASSPAVVPELTTHNSDLTAIEQRRILLFYGEPQVDFSSGQAIIPTRITCYCRHHDEGVGFCFHFTVKDNETGAVLATAFSTPVVITDDHKPLKTGKRARTDVSNTTDSPAQGPGARAPPRPASIEKAVPAEGPTTGGIEVTLLGHNFVRGNTALFGSSEAPTTYWGESTLICILPPAQGPQTVDISLLSANRAAMSNSQATFTYREQSDVHLLSLALQCIGMRMSGRVDSAHEIATEIIQRTAKTGKLLDAGDLDGAGGGSSFNDLANNLTHAPSHSSKFDPDDAVLVSLSKAVAASCQYPLDLNVTDASGATLLHYSAWRGADRLVQWLCKHGSELDVCDNRGLTPLHFAAIRGHSNTLKILLQSGANKDIRADIPARTAHELAVINQHTEAAAVIAHNGDYANVSVNIPAIAPDTPGSLASPAGSTCRGEVSRNGYSRVRMDSQMSTVPHHRVEMVEEQMGVGQKAIQDSFRFRHPHSWRAMHLLMGVSLISVLCVGLINVGAAGPAEAEAPRLSALQYQTNSAPMGEPQGLVSMQGSTFIESSGPSIVPKHSERVATKALEREEPSVAHSLQQQQLNDPRHQPPAAMDGKQNKESVVDTDVEEMAYARLRTHREKEGKAKKKQHHASGPTTLGMPPKNPWGSDPYELPVRQRLKGGVGARVARHHLSGSSQDRGARGSVVRTGARGMANGAMPQRAPSHQHSRGSSSSTRARWICANIDALAALVIVGVSYLKGPSRRLYYCVGALILAAMAQFAFFSLRMLFFA
eukprot:TRINITY_DN6161_c0_g1_i1.p1 TRINITY_DN6161_c0_g1~~TRINITY_DN6161_c0_g1_i1.p1  ORF type:complete len:1017 (+),score=200.94 TRINITY_DN6161_c0_g1_i1:310-3360(+)